MSEPCLSLDIPVRTRILDRLSSLLGFVCECPCVETNDNRYLILYDDFTAAYHSQSDFHLCLCQDFRRHLLNIDYKDLRTYYQQAFERKSSSLRQKYSLNQIIRVRKFDSNYHNARVMEIDCSIIKICFFQRKSQKQIWIHCNASIIEPCPLIVDETSPLESSRLRKRKNSNRTGNCHQLFSIIISCFLGKKMKKKAREPSPSSLDETYRSTMVTAYYTNILFPKFRSLNVLPYAVHQCNRECVVTAEECFSSNQIVSNPFLLPFECRWSIVDSKPRGYRTPCRRTLYSLDDIDQYLYRTQSKLSIKYFIDGVLTRFQPPINEFDRKYLFIDDLSHGLENVTIPVYNSIDEERGNNFIYITENRPMDQRIAAALKDNNMTSCCDCTDK